MYYYLREQYHLKYSLELFWVVVYPIFYGVLYVKLNNTFAADKKNLKKPNTT
jgi:hypothetical protein